MGPHLKQHVIRWGIYYDYNWRPHALTMLRRNPLGGDQDITTELAHSYTITQWLEINWAGYDCGLSVQTIRRACVALTTFTSQGQVPWSILNFFDTIPQQHNKNAPHRDRQTPACVSKHYILSPTHLTSHEGYNATIWSLSWARLSKLLLECSICDSAKPKSVFWKDST